MKKLLFLTLFFASPFVLAADDDDYATCNPSDENCRCFQADDPDLANAAPEDQFVCSDS